MPILLTALPWRPVATASIAALCLLSVVAIWPESGFADVGIKLALVCLAAAAAFVLDEPAAAAVDSAPRTLRARTAMRLVGMALPATIGAGGLLVIAARLGSIRSWAVRSAARMAGCSCRWPVASCSASPLRRSRAGSPRIPATLSAAWSPGASLRW